MMLVSALLLALVVQGFATQTHLHWQNAFLDRFAPAANHLPGQDKYPLNEDPANCPICEQIADAGEYVVPAWLSPFLLVLAISTIEFVNIALPGFDAISHSWRGRGPPLN
jgi:hypothetical protein